MGEGIDINETYQMLKSIKDELFIKRIHAIIRLQIEKENEESNIND